MCGRPATATLLIGSLAAQSVSLLDAARGDHLRLPPQAVLEVGEAAQVLAAIYTAAGPGQGYATFAAYSKLAQVACCSSKTVQRAVAADGPLVRCGFLHRGGRQRRRTVSLELTAKGVGSFDKFYMLPRAVVHLGRKIGEPLRWSERALLAFLVSRQILVGQFEHERPYFGIYGCIHSISDLRKVTGLTRASIIAGRRQLECRRLIEVGDWVDARKPDGLEIQLNPGFAIDAHNLPDSAMDVLRSDGARVSADANVSVDLVRRCPLE